MEPLFFFPFPVGKNHDVLNNTLFTKFSRQIQFLSLKNKNKMLGGHQLNYLILLIFLLFILSKMQAQNLVHSVLFAIIFQFSILLSLLSRSLQPCILRCKKSYLVFLIEKAKRVLTLQNFSTKNPIV